MKKALILSSLVLGADFTGYPRTFYPAPADPSISALYDLSNVPNIPQNLPEYSTSPPACVNIPSSACNWGCQYCFRDTDVYSCPNLSDWGLSFDDGPSQYTPQVLDKLKTLNVTASFFVIGSQILLYPEVLKRTYDEGHQIVVHTWSHRALTSLTNDVIIAELEWTLRAINSVLGIRPKYFRPPFGDIDDRVRGVAAAMGLRPIIWNYDTGYCQLIIGDWKIPTSEALVVAQTTSTSTSTPTTTNTTLLVPLQTLTTPPKTNATKDGPEMQAVVSGVSTRASQWQSSKAGVVSLEHDLYITEANTALKVIDAIYSSGMNIKSVAQCINENSPYGQFVPQKVGTKTSIGSYSATASSTGAPTQTQNSMAEGIKFSILLLILLLLKY